MKKIPLEEAIEILEQHDGPIMLPGLGEATITLRTEEEPYPMFGGFFLDVDYSDPDEGYDYNYSFHVDDNQEVVVEGPYMRLLASDEETEVELKFMLTCPADLENQAVTQSREITVYIAAVEHQSGTDLHTGNTQAALYAKLADYCRSHWDTVSDSKQPVPECDVEVVEVYFDDHENDSLTTGVDFIEVTDPRIYERGA